MSKGINKSLFSKGTLDELEMVELKGGDARKPIKSNCPTCPKDYCSCPITNMKCPSCSGLVADDYYSETSDTSVNQGNLF
jgi:hypothetical protein